MPNESAAASAASGGAGAAATATAAADQKLAVDSSDDDASREMKANVQIDQSPDSSPTATRAAAAKRDISSVEISTKEPPPKKAAAGPSHAAGSDPSSVTSTGMAQASTATGGSLNDAPKCDPTFAARVNLDPVPSVKPLPKLSHRDIAELELVSMIGMLVLMWQL